MTWSRSVWLWQEHSPATNLPFSPTGYLPYLSTLSAASCSPLPTNCRSQSLLLYLRSAALTQNTPLPSQEEMPSLHLPCAFTPCPSASFSSFPALVLQTEVPQSTGGQPSTREWELHKNINLCSSPTTWPLIQLFFLAFASSFLAAPKSLPVQLQLLFRFHWNLSRFLNMLRDIFFPNFLKGALKTQGMRSPISIPTPCHFRAGRNQVQQDFWRAKFHISRHMQTDSERFNWLGTVKQKTHYQNYPALNTPPREHVSSANARPAEKRENSITQRTGYSTLTH